MLGGLLFVVVIMNALIDWIQEMKSASIFAGFANMLPPETLVTRNGQQRRIPAAELVLGDVVTVRAGDKVPADLRVIHNRGVKVFGRAASLHHRLFTGV